MIHDFTNEDIDWGDDRAINNVKQSQKTTTITEKRPNKYDYKEYFDALKKAAQVGILNYDAVVDVMKDTCFKYIDYFEQLTRNVKNTCDYICGRNADKKEAND